MESESSEKDILDLELEAVLRAAAPDVATERLREQVETWKEGYDLQTAELRKVAAERDAAVAAIERVRKYADERSVYAKTRNNIVGSWRIASDLYDLLGVSHEEQAALDGAPEPEWEAVAEYGVKYAPTNNRASYTVRFGYESREDAEHSLGRLGRNQKRNPDRLMYREVRTGPWLPVEGESES